MSHYVKPTTWIPDRTERIAISLAGLLLVASGAFHVAVWLVQGDSLEGDVSWRKPILFGFSAGATMLSIGWLIGKFPRRVGDAIYLTLFSLAMLAEVGLITLQQWRGVASHFNRSTPFDANVLRWIELLILFATIVIADLTIRCFGRLSVARDMKWAIRSGMVFLLIACLLGFVMVWHGDRQLALGKPHGVYGEAGVMKFPHGMPIHAIQYLPILAWTLRRTGLGESVRHRVIVGATCSLAVFTLFSIVQTFSGRGRFDVTWVTGSLLAAAILSLLVPLSRAVSSIFGLRRNEIVAVAND